MGRLEPPETVATVPYLSGLNDFERLEPAERNALFSVKVICRE
jgi:hypothetical protein